MSEASESQADLRSQHTSNFPDLLNQLGISLLVSTYQAGKVILLREQQGILNTHFKSFDRPMGVAISKQNLAISCRHTILNFCNVPSLAKNLGNDTCYIPLSSHVTGAIDCHEMVYLEDELWFVNTQFSCLCTLDESHSFVPHWRPPFISAYSVGDRCHLNGIAVRDGEVRYVTALGQTDVKGGWRNNKTNGGLLIDIKTNQVILNNLSMPHSPRWYQEKLWFLESGYGSLSRVDLGHNTHKRLIQMPGFTRGCAFYRDYAFVGLSKVRESATFSGLPITQTLEERICGIWVVHLPTEEVVSFLKFQGDVEEIFAVEVLPHSRNPDLIEWGAEEQKTLYVLPDEVFNNIDHDPVETSISMKHFIRANELYAQHRLDEAIAAYRDCLKEESDYVPAQYNLGVALGDIGQWEAALEELKKVLNFDVAHAEAHNSLAYVYVNLNQFAQAIMHYEKALKINPKYEQARKNLRQVQTLMTDSERK